MCKSINMGEEVGNLGNVAEKREHGRRQVGRGFCCAQELGL